MEHQVRCCRINYLRTLYFDELLIIKPKKPSAIEPFDTGISFTTTKPNIRTTTTIPFFLNKQNIYLFAHWITLVKQSRQKAGEHKEKENTEKKKS